MFKYNIECTVQCCWYTNNTFLNRSNECASCLCIWPKIKIAVWRRSYGAISSCCTCTCSLQNYWWRMMLNKIWGKYSSCTISKGKNFVIRTEAEKSLVNRKSCFSWTCMKSSQINVHSFINNLCQLYAISSRWNLIRHFTGVQWILLLPLNLSAKQLH